MFYGLEYILYIYLSSLHVWGMLPPKPPANHEGLCPQTTWRLKTMMGRGIRSECRIISAYRSNMDIIEP